MKLETYTTLAPDSISKKEAVKKTKKNLKQLKEYQYKLYAEGKKSMLIILQGIDASGKDSVIKHIIAGMNPQGTKTTSFTVPTKEEFGHDFLWRIHKRTPKVGQVMIFNRSHYEDILVPQVQKTFPSTLIKKRYTHINNFEQMLQDEGTTILKFFLHISQKKQKEKLYNRLLNKTKHRKFDASDWDTHQAFDKYMEIYQDIITTCNTPERHIIPSDKKWYKFYLISEILCKEFKKMKLQWPDLSKEKHIKKLQIKAQLAEEYHVSKKKTKP